MRSLGIMLILVAAMLFGSCGGEKCDHESVTAEHLGGAPNRPFCEAVKVGRWLILSGQLGIDPETGKLAEGGIQAETRQTMENIKKTLEKYGSSMAQVVKCTVMLADVSEWGAMNEIYVTYFPDHKPARSAFGASGLALNARVEIECWAFLK
jgi:2-iminobutanoate/2-iminopropanoate deaminase